MGHELYTIEVSKIGLSCFDDKRYILSDGFTSYAYGHYKIKELESEFDFRQEDAPSLN